MDAADSARFREVVDWISKQEIDPTKPVPLPLFIASALVTAPEVNHRDETILKVYFVAKRVERNASNNTTVKAQSEKINNYLARNIRNTSSNESVTPDNLTAEMTELYLKLDKTPELRDMKNAQLRYKLAENLAKGNSILQIDGGNLFDYLKAIKPDQDDLITLARIFISRNPGEAVKYLNKLGITDPKAIIGLIKLCIDAGGVAIVKNLAAAGVTDKNTLFEIAEYCADYDVKDTAKCIMGLGLNMEQRVKIAQLCAQRDGGATSIHIKHFCLADENTLVEIAKLCAQGDGDRTTKNIAEFLPIGNMCFTDDDDLFDIFLIAFNNSDAALDHLPWIDSTEAPEKWELLILARSLRQNENSVTKDQIANVLNTHFNVDLTDLLQRVDSKWILSFIRTVIPISQLEDSGKKWVEKGGYIRALVKIQNIDFVERLGPMLLREAAFPHAADQKPFNDKTSWRLLAQLIYVDLERQGVKPAVLERIRNATEKSSEYSVSMGYNPLIEMLLNVAESAISPVEKTTILAKIGTKVPLDDVRAINATFLFNEPLDLLRDASPQAVLENLLKTKLSIGELEGVAEKYLNTFDSSRFPLAIPIYAAKLIQFNDLRAIDALREIVVQVLNGTFVDDRYNLERSPHLQQLHAHDKDILNKWREGLSSVVGKDIGKNANVVSQNPRDWLRLKIQEKHFPLAADLNPNYLQRFLDGDMSAKKELSEALQQRAGSKHELLLQRGLIEFAESENKSPKEVAAILSRLIKAIEKVNQPIFLKDLNDQLKTLNQTPAVKEGLHVFDSDDAYDLLLCGQEVYGSCQSLDGEASLNRGVLGYLQNGWNRILKVSTGKDDPIQARCKIQLLWGDGKPVLFRERFYSKGPLSELHKEALNKLAMQKAEQLGIPLLCSDGEGGAYEGTVEARGGPSPYEYSDAAGPGVLREYGTYQISGARYMKNQNIPGDGPPDLSA